MVVARAAKTRIAAADRVRNGDLKPMSIDGQWVCLDCRQELPQNMGGRGRKARPLLRCTPCAATRRQFREGVRNAAYRAVAAALQAGTLMKAQGQPCADCGRPAEVFDHRDYTKPLEVEPVCRSCNVMRGPADVWPELIGAKGAPKVKLAKAA